MHRIILSMIWQGDRRQLRLTPSRRFEWSGSSLLAVGPTGSLPCAPLGVSRDGWRGLDVLEGSPFARESAEPVTGASEGEAMLASERRGSEGETQRMKLMKRADGGTEEREPLSHFGDSAWKGRVTSDVENHENLSAVPTAGRCRCRRASTCLIPWKEHKDLRDLFSADKQRSEFTAEAASHRQCCPARCGGSLLTFVFSRPLLAIILLSLFFYVQKNARFTNPLCFSLRFAQCW